MSRRTAENENLPPGFSVPKAAENPPGEKPKSRIQQYRLRIANDKIGDRGEDEKYGAYVVSESFDQMTQSYGPMRIYEGKQRGFRFTLQPRTKDSDNLIAVPYLGKAGQPSTREISEAAAEESDPDVKSIHIDPKTGRKTVAYYPDKQAH